MQIETKQGSATSAKPCRANPSSVVPFRGVIIAHLCNNENKWGAGFVLAVNELSLAARDAYRALCKDHGNQVPLGTTQFVELQPDVWAANMIAQNGTDKSKVPDDCLVDYPALEKCLETVFMRAALLGCNVHMPSGMGSGLAGGDESTIHGMIRTCSSSLKMTLLEQRMAFHPSVTLWEFQDTDAASYVGKKPTAAPQAMVDSVFGTSDDTDADEDEMLDMDDILDGL